MSNNEQALFLALQRAISINTADYELTVIQTQAQVCKIVFAYLGTTIETTASLSPTWAMASARAVVAKWALAHYITPPSDAEKVPHYPSGSYHSREQVKS